jgi:hypothetical protein
MGDEFKGVGTLNERHGSVLLITPTVVQLIRPQSVPARNFIIKTYSIKLRRAHITAWSTQVNGVGYRFCEQGATFVPFDLGGAV